MTKVYAHRCTALQKTLQAHQALLISNARDIAYFTGFFTLLPTEREAFLIITAKTAQLFYSAFCPVTKQPGITYHPTGSVAGLTEKIAQLPSEGISMIGVDKTSLFVNEFEGLQKINGLDWEQLDKDKIWQLRRVKDKTEQDSIRKAADLTVQAYEAAHALLKTGMTELEIAVEIEFFIKRRGGQLAFPIIVAFGEHSALPHHQPTNTKLTDKTVVLIDLGAQVDGYCADMTRTIWFGKNPSDEFKKIETIIRTAYAAAKNACAGSSGATQLMAKDVDLAARHVIEEAGYGKTFIHTTGHGLGLDIHESPSLYKTQTTVLLPGMIITIEPGIYLEGNFGYRYENTLLLKKQNSTELTES